MRSKRGTVLIVSGTGLAAFGALWLVSSLLAEGANLRGFLAGALISFVLLALGFALLREGQKRRKRYVAAKSSQPD